MVCKIIRIPWTCYSKLPVVQELLRIGYQDGSQHDVSWMNKSEPGAGSYVNLMECSLIKETYSDYGTCHDQILHREAGPSRDCNHNDKVKAVQQVCKRN